VRITRLGIGWAMALVAVATLDLAGLALTTSGQDGRTQITPECLPIRYAGETGIIEMPLTTRQLGWMPHPSRTITSDRLEPPDEVGPPKEGDGPDGDGPDKQEVPQPVKIAGPVGLRHPAIKSECFDLWVYGETTEQEKHVWLLTTLSAKIAKARKQGITATHERKLILAGRGDIKRFFDRVEALRSEFEEVRKDLNAGVGVLRGLPLMTLSKEFQDGPFGDESLFAKTLAKIENDQAQKEPR
jgi:hypothetical protein